MKRRNFLVSLVMLVFVFASFSLIAEEVTSKQIVVEKIQKIKNPESDFQVTLTVNKKDATYKEGEEIKLKFKSTKDCYLTLIDVGTDGKVTIFFPNKYQKDNKIKAGQVYYIPQKDAKWLLRVKGPAGKEVIKAIATLEKKDLVKEEYLKPAADEEVFQVVEEEKTENFAKNISVELKPVDTKKWAEAEQIIKVEEKKMQKEWATKQAEFKSAFEKVKELDGKPYLEANDKVTAWERLLQGYSQDNPFTLDDDRWRSYIRERIQYWKERELPDHVRKIKSKARRVYKNDKGFWEAEFDYDIVMVYIPAGEFRMGYDEYNDEKPLHNVYLDGYWIGKHEITVGQFKIFVNDTGYRTDAEKGNGAFVFIGKKWQKKSDASWRNPYFSQNDYHPVVCVSWNDAVAFCNWLSRNTGINFHLPTEAQWEKACRAGTQTTFYFGNSISSYQANFDGNYPYGGASKGPYLKKTTPVGNYSANNFGIYDMHGNVWEWCSDWYDKEYYNNSPYKNPVGPSSGSARVVRGGGWGDDAGYLRCAFRRGSTPAGRGGNLGFRLSQDK